MATLTGSKDNPFFFLVSSAKVFSNLLAEVFAEEEEEDEGAYLSFSSGRSSSEILEISASSCLMDSEVLLSFPSATR